MKEKLGCPVCKEPYKVQGESYYCVKCDATYGKNEGLLNFFPITGMKNDVTSLSENIFPEAIYKEDVACLINSAYFENIRGADKVIQRIVGINMNQRNKEQREALVPQLLGDLILVYEKNAKLLPEEKRPFLLSFITLFRYELETVAGSYNGNFIVPDSILKKLPKGEYLEIAMGTGDNLKKVAKSGKSTSITGLDFSRGMVSRAMELFDSNSLLFRADAQSLPLIDEQYDVVMMFNALDRIPKTKQALEEVNRVLKYNGSFVVGNCIPLQNEKMVEGGFTLTYVPEKYRIESMEEAIENAGCNIQCIQKNLEWRVKTIEDGDEKLFVDVAIGKKI